MNSSTRFLVLVRALCALLALFLSTAQAQERKELHSQVSAPAGAKLIGRMPAWQRLSLAVSLPLCHEDQLAALLQQLYDPASSNYRHFLTVQQFTEQFGPTEVDYLRVIGFAQAHGLNVTHTFPNRLVVDVTGPVANIEQAFQVKMHVYQHPTENRTFYAPDIEPTVEPGLPVLSVVGMSTFALPQPMLKRALPNDRVHSQTTGSGQGGQFLGSDMRTAYGGGTSLNGAGQVVGLIELGPYRLSDVTSYFTTLGQSLNVPIVNVLVGVNGVCGVGCDDGEEVIDIQQAISMAPNLSGLLVYETNGPSTDALSAYAQAASDNIAKQLSISFGWGDVPSSTTGKAYEQVFEELEAQGTSSFVASGDAGASLSGGYPGNSPNITDAGGTDLTTGTGQVWSSESGWIGSGGGWNPQSPIPTTPTYSWNQAPAINSSNGGDPNYRNIPDVSAEANTDNYFCANGSCQGGIGGTSLAAPRWAAFVALINQQAAANATATGNNTSLGFLNPTIYTLSSGNYASDFHDITTGNNATTTTCSVGSLGCLPSGVEGFDAVTGFDLVTGWGSPKGPTIFDSLFPTTTNANFSMSATPSTIPLTAAGNGGSSLISVTALQGFSAATSLTAVIPGTGSPSYAPAGLTASLSATSIPAGGTPVTLTVGTTAATPGGTYEIAIVGTSGGLTQTAYVTVELPAFVGLRATPAAGISVNQGGSASSTVTSTLINGFNGTVNLSASGLPSGVTASFTPVNATTATVTFTASATAALTGSGKPTTVTITGTVAGSASQQTAVNVFVNPAASGGSGTVVDLSSAYNVSAFYTDADQSAITTGLDGVGFAFSANLLNSGADVNGVQFTFGSPNQPNAVYGTGSPITLPVGTFATLQLLATGIEGNQAAQTVTVTYTDSSTSQFTQSFSDWCSHLNGGCTSTGGNSGESVAVAMPYRDSSTGPDDRVFYLYHYSFALNASKTVQSLTLPNNRDVVVLAATLTAPPPSYSLSAGTANPTSVNAGGTSTATVTVTPANGYTGSITLSCSISPVVSGADAPTCSFGSTNPVAITGSAAGNATLAFTTIAPPGKAAFRRAANGPVPTPPSQGATRSLSAWYAWLSGAWIVIPGLALIGLGFGPRGSRRRKCLSIALISIVSACLIILPACGGGSSGGGGSGGCSTVPSVPTGLAASATTSSATTLTWTASTATSGCSVTGYTVYQNGTSIATTTSPTYNVTGLTASTQYAFSVAASDSDGASAQTTALDVTTLSNGTPSGTYTITLTGKDANGIAQSNTAATTVSVTVN
ncbi:MAG TPA: protease pro-enzyme activation domain-containing protein [Candidatus Acidoferrum sp.]|nr:protease pro-enzyme activation domain-containing protein [Candidatus Acidoferrum sp.]